MVMVILSYELLSVGSDAAHNNGVPKIYVLNYQIFCLPIDCITVLLVG